MKRDGVGQVGQGGWERNEIEEEGRRKKKEVWSEQRDVAGEYMRQQAKALAMAGVEPFSHLSFLTSVSRTGHSLGSRQMIPLK